MSAHDDFSLHDDEELSLHDDASLAGSVPASNKGDAPAKPPQIITTNTLSNIKLPVLQKDDYDTWANEIEHYLRFFLNRTGKKKDTRFADEKKGKRELLSKAVPKRTSQTFHAWMMPKEICQLSKQKKGNDSFQKLSTQLMPYGASVSDEDQIINLDQIDDLDLEEMDINWQIAMTAIKIKKFYKKTGRRPRVDGKMHVAFDKRKVECFNAQYLCIC
ncbi:hypothetical protein Tco_0843465 [Tanacetum coccineum]|uniref:Uncharacterized protein n=1 Tax=Tanacetum coccineum TaxID=301880 RepID=A0ABQ5B650_9ASTR